MTTCTVRDPLAEAQAKMAELLSEWVAAGKPQPLKFMARFAGQSARLLRKAGQTDEWIRNAILPVLESVIATYPRADRASFLRSVEHRLTSSLPPLPAAVERPRSTDPAQERFDIWVENMADSIETAPLMAMVESLKGLACTLRSIGRRDGSIRAQVEEIVRTNCVAMRPQDHAFIVGRVRNALDEVLGEIA